MPLSTHSFTIAAVAAACLILMPGCDRRTPEERLQTALEFYQQGDVLSAEMEAQKVVEKAPEEDPAAIQASALLANIYASQNRFDEAELQLTSALDNVSQLEPAGKDLLRMYLSLLSSQGKYDEALKMVEKYQQEYAEDEGTSLSLTVASIDIKTQSGETTAARSALSDLIDRTTDTQEQALYRDLYLRTYMADQNTTDAIEYLEQNMADFTDEEKQSALIALASLYGTHDNYVKSRSYLEQATNNIMDMVRQELDRRAKAGLSLQLAQAYMSVGNLPGARRVFQTIYESGITDPQLLVAAVNGLSENLLRMGETSATEELLKEAAAKYPQAPFKEQLGRLNEIIAQGELESVAPMDTSTLAMRYREDPNILWPSDLPSVLGQATTGTVTGEAPTTGVAVAPDSLRTTATMETESAATASQSAEEPPVPVADEAPMENTAPTLTETPTAETAPAAPEAPAETEAPAPADANEATTPPAAPQASEPEAAPAPANDLTNSLKLHFSPGTHQSQFVIQHFLRFLAGVFELFPCQLFVVLE